MGLQEKATEIAKVMEEVKERWVADPANEGQTDLSIYLHFWRGEEMVATVVCPLDRDTGLHAGLMGAKGFNATTMAITFESYHTELAESPLSGQPWRPHEMQYVFYAHPEEDWVTECLTTSVHERDGAFVLHSQAFKIEDGHVIWGDSQLHHVSSEDEITGNGVMFEYLQQAMKEPLLMAELQKEGEKSPLAQLMLTLVNDPEEQYFHADAATARILMDRKLAITVMLGAEPGTKREEWIKERFGETE
jgi:hypothetical protein